MKVTDHNGTPYTPPSGGRVAQLLAAGTPEPYLLERAILSERLSIENLGLAGYLHSCHPRKNDGAEFCECDDHGCACKPYKRGSLKEDHMAPMHLDSQLLDPDSEYQASLARKVGRSVPTDRRADRADGLLVDLDPDAEYAASLARKSKVRS